MKRIRKTIVLLAALAPLTAACDDGTSAPDQPDSSELDDAEVEEELPYVSAIVAFDPDNVDEPTREVSASVVTVKSADGEEIPSDVLEEIDDMRLRFGHALVVAKGAPYFAARSADEERIEITYLGKGRLAPADHDFEAAFQAELGEKTEDGSYEPPAKYQDDATWVTGFNPTTQSEFEVRIPYELSEIVGAAAKERRANPETNTPWEAETFARHQVGSQDTRVRKGALDTAQTSTNLSRIVRFGSGNTGSATGVLIGKNQVLTAGHRLYGSNGWNDSVRMRVGANGSGNHGDISLGAALGNGNETWTADGSLFWVSSLFKSARDNGGSTIAYDIGTIVLPNDPIGEPVGWFNIADPSNVSHDDMYNRGYANCGAASPPPSCSDPDNWFHMFGDTRRCRTGGFSSNQDPWGYSNFGYHSCDASSGQSGSPLYRYDQNDGWVVRGVHVGKHRWGYSGSQLQGLSNSQAALSVTLVTQGRKNLFDFYNSMYTSP